MELRQLFTSSRWLGNCIFGRAAARMCIAQPALSTQVQALEMHLGVQLLHRTTRRVELTRAGEVFYDRCIRILSDIKLSAEMACSADGKGAREIRIGTIYPATIGVLPSFLSRIARECPGIRMHIASGSTSDIIRSIEAGQLNLGFIRPVENIGSLRFFSISHERYLLAVCKDSPLAAMEDVGIEELRDQRIISFSRSNLSYTEPYFADLWPVARLPTGQTCVRPVHTSAARSRACPRRSQRRRAQFQRYGSGLPYVWLETCSGVSHRSGNAVWRF